MSTSPDSKIRSGRLARLSLLQKWLLIFAALWLIGDGLLLCLLNFFYCQVPTIGWLFLIYLGVLLCLMFGWLLALGWPFITGRRYGLLAGTISIYLLGVAVFALWTIKENLPMDNYLTSGFKSLKIPVQVELLKQLTIDSLTTLHKAQDAITRWQSLGGLNQVSLADQHSIQEGLVLAAQLNTNVVYSTGTSSQSITNIKTSLLTNNFAIANLSGSSWMLSTMVLTQVSQTISSNGTLTNHTNTIVGQSPVLPLTGDLRLITARQLANASTQLGIAIQKLNARYAFLVKYSGDGRTDVAASLWKDEAGISPLTPNEYLSLQDLVQRASANSGQFGASQFNLFIIFIAFGCIGSCVKCLASLARYLGVRKFKPSWAAYYFLHPLIGGLLALIFYLMFKSNITATMASPAPVLDSLGYCALAVLVGMFSDEATKKLEKIAQGLLTNNDDKDDADDPNVICIESVRIAGQPDFTALNITDLPGLVSLFKAQLTAADGTRLDPQTGPLDPPTLAGIKNTEDLSKFLVSKFAAATRIQLAAYTSGTDTLLFNSLVTDLNMVIKTELLYQAPIFTSITSPAVAKLQKLVYGTKTMPAAAPVQSEIHQLNRWLLAWAYPNKLACWVITLQGHGLRQDTIIFLDGKSLPNGVITTFTNNQLRFALRFSDHEPGTLALTVRNPAPNSAQSNEFDVSLN
jgi:hypothetical protein